MDRKSIIRFAIYITLIVGMVIGILMFRTEERIMLILTIALLICFIGGAVYYYHNVVHPLYILKRKLQMLIKGSLRDAETTPRGRELASIEHAISDHVMRQRKLVKVLSDLADGKVVDDFAALSSRDEIGQAIQKLRESINQSVEEAEKRRMYDEQQKWTSAGLAGFGDIFREFSNDLENFSNRFICELVNYIPMEVGGLFLLREKGDKTLEYHLYGAYAFDRNKFIKRGFKAGEGLVGRCALEKKTIYMTDVPEDYIRIRSGMGEDKPSCLLLVPVILDERVLGIIELASFDTLQPYKIQFVEALAGSLGSTLAKTRLLS
ncbi:MAG TPA: GAF domain-containing protein [Bacteroidales bacterium]|nr:GAF domain-containing protein [Bacteroidales bacterium]